MTPRFERIRDGLGWRFDSARQAVAPYLARWEFLGRRAYWPVPWFGPMYRARVAVGRTRAIGDILMCTPALRQLKRLNPHCRITVYTGFPSLLRGLPFIDEVRDDLTACPRGTIWLGYEHAIPPRRHITRIIGDCLGVRVTDIRPSCAVRPDLLSDFQTRWRKFGRPVVILNRAASGWTPNKEWPAAYWDELIPLLMRNYAVVEIGAAPTDPAPTHSGDYLDLRGQTDLDSLVAAIAAADLHVGPVSGPVHIAAAFRVPAVVIYGGYEPPLCAGYPGNVHLYSAEPCAPCWLRTPCPYERKCLTRITPNQVAESVRGLLRKRSRA